MLLSCDHLDKSFGDRTILRDASFHIQENQKTALIGANGIGKTTLLRIIMDEERADGGTITRSKEMTIGYLPQQLGYHSDKSIYEELYAVRSDIIEQEQKLHELEDEIAIITTNSPILDTSDKPPASVNQSESVDSVSSDKLLEEYHRLQTDFELKDGYAYRSQVLGVINGLGFGGDTMNQVINDLSGGQKTRVALGKLLLLKPDLLILDEPTNHLDIASVQWLENYLASYPGAVLIVSHDRYFLDRFTEQVLELDRGSLRSFKGNYTSYVKQKDVLMVTLIRQYEKQQAEIHHQEEVIRKLKSYNREKSIRRAESREKMLDKIERMDNPDEHIDKMHFTLEPAVVSGKDVLMTDGLGKSFGEHVLFENVNIDIKRGEKVAIIGDNGTGKTTLLRMVNGAEPLSAGTITLGTGVEPGYYDQEHGILHDDKTIFEEIQDDYPYLDNTQIRNTLAAFLFRGDDVYKPISSLSGGEKGRVSLAKLMLSEANLLLLDEPTNHLDMESREILESALREYTGTVICVSHDRYFINSIATRILDLANGQFHDYRGNYAYYLEKHDEVMEKSADQTKNNTGTISHSNMKSSNKSRLSGRHGMSSATSATSTTADIDKNQKSHIIGEPDDDSPSSGQSDSTEILSSREQWLADKERQAERRRLERACEEAENLIEELENQINDIDTALSDPAVGTDLARLTELTNQRNELDESLGEAMERWETLSEQL